MKINKLPQDVPIKIDPNLLNFKQPFLSLFLYKRDRMLDISQDMKENGFDAAYAVKCIRIGDKLYVVEGHHRVKAAIVAEIKVIIIIVNYKSEYEAFLDARKKQGKARKFDNSELFQCVITSNDTTNYKKGAQVKPSGTTTNRGKLKTEISQDLRVSERLVSRCFTIIDKGTESQKQKVLSGKKTINAVYNEIINSEKPKEEKQEIITTWYKDCNLKINGKRILSLNPGFRYGNDKNYLKIKSAVEAAISEVLR